MEPPIDAVRPSYSVLDFVSFPGGYRAFPGTCHKAKIVLMNQITRLPFIQSSGRCICTDVFQIMAVDILYLASRRQERHQGGDCVGDIAVLLMARSQGVC